ETGPQKWDTLRVPRLPKWLRNRLNDAWGADILAAIEKAHFAGAPLDLTSRATDFTLPDATVLPTGSLRITGSPQVSALPGYDDGSWWVQDAAAAIAARALNVQAGEVVADLCAAPGGKTLQLAAAGAEVTAVDSATLRLATLEENLARTGLTAKVVEADVLSLSGQYDAILLDAPCSATGTIRRHPDLPHVRDGSGLSDLTRLQGRMLDHAWTLLKPGGRMVFCTCSLLPIEGEAQILTALTRHSDMQTDPDALALPGIDPSWVNPKIGLRLRPDYWADIGGMDGFFIAALRKSD
ncbi:MAG: RsmB/NOP family class I SAM-dependent RNA methyltransferase, partial [Paracoccaceae bacterium]